MISVVTPKTGLINATEALPEQSLNLSQRLTGVDVAWRPVLGVAGGGIGALAKDRLTSDWGQNESPNAYSLSTDENRKGRGHVSP